MKFALSTEQLGHAVIAYLKEHKHELTEGKHSVRLGDGPFDVTLTFEITKEGEVLE